MYVKLLCVLHFILLMVSQRNMKLKAHLKWMNVVVVAIIIDMWSEPFQNLLFVDNTQHLGICHVSHTQHLSYLQIFIFIFLVLKLYLSMCAAQMGKWNQSCLSGFNRGCCNSEVRSVLFFCVWLRKKEGKKCCLNGANWMKWWCLKWWVDTVKNWLPF